MDDDESQYLDDIDESKGPSVDLKEIYGLRVKEKDELKKKKKSTKTVAVQFKLPVKKIAKSNTKCCADFPCFCGLPLEIAMQIMAVFDMVHCSLSMVMWSTLLGLDIFGNKKGGNTLEKPFIPPNKEPKIPPYDNPFKPTEETTRMPPWTLRTSSTEIPKYDYEAVDLDELSRVYSKIAFMTITRHTEVEEHCGSDYINKYLFTYQLERTKNLWEEFLWQTITAEVLYVLIAMLTLMSVCCFIEHRGAKLLVMILWWFQWIPIFIDIEGLIISQSKRLCILEYGWTSVAFRGQTFFFMYLITRLLIFKPYQLLVQFYYIKELLIYGFLKDETANTAPGSENEEAHAKQYFKDFYALEREKEGNVALESYEAQDTSNAINFDILDSSDVARIQKSVMTAQDDPFSVRNREVRNMQASGQIDHGLKSIRKT